MSVYAGLMSGTSCDGMDLAIVDFAEEHDRILNISNHNFLHPYFLHPQQHNKQQEKKIRPLYFRVLAADYLPYSPVFRRRLLDLYSVAYSPLSYDEAIDLVASCDHELARYAADLVNRSLVRINLHADKIKALGFHGHTLRHKPDATYSAKYGTIPAYTWQIGNPNLLAELTGITVVNDFRRRDVAAGGQGAPLVSGFHDACFHHIAPYVAIINIGGIANLTAMNALAQEEDASLAGFDIGPGNMLMDAWITYCQGKNFDQDGQWAASGTPIDALLQRLLQEPYLHTSPPKTTGRELFHLSWLQQHLAKIKFFRQEDVQATLLQYTVVTIKQAVMQIFHTWLGTKEGKEGEEGKKIAATARVVVCGGGALNKYLMRSLKASLAPIQVSTTMDYAIKPNHVEAVAFAWLARQTLSARPGNITQVTGARGARMLGGIYL